MLLSYSSLFLYEVGKDLTVVFLPYLVLPSPGRGQKYQSPHPHLRPGAALEQEELPLIQSAEGAM